MKTACETEEVRRTKDSFLQLLAVVEDEAAAKFESNCRHKSYWVMLLPYVYLCLPFPLLLWRSTGTRFTTSKTSRFHELQLHKLKKKKRQASSK